MYEEQLELDFSDSALDFAASHGFFALEVRE